MFLKKNYYSSRYIYNPERIIKYQAGTGFYAKKLEKEELVLMINSSKLKEGKNEKESYSVFCVCKHMY